MLGKEVWAVIYTTGQYSDRCETLDKCFESEAGAQAYAQKQNSKLKEFGVHGSQGRNMVSWDAREAAVKALGLPYGIDYTGGDYVVEGPVELLP